MSIWDLSDGSNASSTGGEFETGGGNMEPIPSNTRLKAMIDDAKWDEFNGDRFISLRWVCLDPSDYKNRKVFQKVRVYDQKPEKADKAKRMLAAIDTNAGGKLSAAGGEPTDHDLQAALLNKPMMIEVQVWEMEGGDGQTRTGNWVNRVAPAGGAQPQQQAPKPSVEAPDVPF